MTDPRPIVVKKIVECARCGKDHENVVAEPLRRPFAPQEAAPIVWTHWTPCPANGQPVLMFFAVDVTEGPGGKIVHPGKDRK